MTQSNEALPCLAAEEFLERMQELILRTPINSTYKLALLQAIVNCALMVDAAGGEGFCTISLNAVAREFLRLYWPMRMPFHSGAEDSRAQVLYQGINARAGSKQTDRIFTIIEAALLKSAKASGPGPAAATFEQISHDKALMAELTRQCIAHIKKNPLHYIRKDAAFLFEAADDSVVLRKSSVLLLQRFAGLFTELLQSRWEQAVRGNAANAAAFGTGKTRSLREFLFGTPRTSLAAVQKVLSEASDASHCFYCGQKLAQDAVQVDHFIPHSVYSPVELFNFVLACPRCNASKSNWLAASRHVKLWAERNQRFGSSLIEAAAEQLQTGVVNVALIALNIYGVAERRSERLWLRRSRDTESGFEFGSDQYREIRPMLEDNLNAMQDLL